VLALEEVPGILYYYKGVTYESLYSDQYYLNMEKNIYNSKRNEKGQFVRTTGNTRYRGVQYNGKRMGEHQKIWIQKYGAIPRGCVIHHIDENKLNNNIENLECRTYGEHNKIHSHPAWNKGITTHHGNNEFGHTVSKKQIYKQKCTLFNKYLDSYIKIWELKDSGLTNKDIALKLNITKRQVDSRWRGFKKAYLIPFREVYK